MSGNVLPLRKTSKLTICVNCAHHLVRDPRLSDVWTKHLCATSPLPLAIDPVDGKEKPVAINDNGDQYFSDDKYCYCRDINQGNCSKFKKTTEKPIPKWLVI